MLATAGAAGHPTHECDCLLSCPPQAALARGDLSGGRLGPFWDRLVFSKVKARVGGEALGRAALPRSTTRTGLAGWHQRNTTAAPSAFLTLLTDPCAPQARCGC